MTTGITSNRLARAVGIVAAFGVPIGLLVSFIIASSGNTATTPRSFSRPVTYVTCSITSDEYTVRIDELSGYPIQINGFTVTFATNSQITGSDTEPGNGYVNGIALIGMNDWLVPGQTLRFNVQPDSGIPDATACAVMQVNQSRG
jgi:hypothetical protein